MIKKLQRRGDSLALVIEQRILDALGIDADSELQVTVNGNSLILTPVDVGIGREEVREAIDRLRPFYGEMLRRLAD